MNSKLLNISLACLGTLLTAIGAVVWTKLEAIDDRQREQDKVLVRLVTQLEYYHGGVEGVRKTDGNVRAEP